MVQIEKSPLLREVKESREFPLFILIVPWVLGFFPVLQMISFFLSEVSPQSYNLSSFKLPFSPQVLVLSRFVSVLVDRGGSLLRSS